MFSHRKSLQRVIMYRLPKVISFYKKNYSVLKICIIIGTNFSFKRPYIFCTPCTVYVYRLYYRWSVDIWLYTFSSLTYLRRVSINLSLQRTFEVLGIGGGTKYYIYRVQSSVWRLPNYWPPTPSPPNQSVLTRTGRWGGGESIFRKTPDIGLASYSIIPLRVEVWTNFTIPGVRSYIWFFNPRKQGLEKVMISCSLNLSHWY